MKNYLFCIFAILFTVTTVLAQHVDLIANPLEVHCFDLELLGAEPTKESSLLGMSLTGKPGVTLNNCKDIIPGNFLQHGYRLTGYRLMELAKVFNDSQEFYEYSKEHKLNNGGFKTTGIALKQGMVLLVHRYRTIAKLELQPGAPNPIHAGGGFVAIEQDGPTGLKLYRCRTGDDQESFFTYVEGEHSIYAAETLDTLRAAFVPPSDAQFLEQQELDTLMADFSFHNSLYWSVELPEAYYELMLQAAYESGKADNAFVERISELKSYQPYERITAINRNRDGDVEVRYFETYGDEEAALSGLKNIKYSTQNTSAYGEGAGLSTAISKRTEWKSDGNLVTGYLILNDDFRTAVEESTKKLDKLPPPKVLKGK